MTIYTTCAACGLLLHYVDSNTHPNCPAVDPVDRDLEQRYVNHLTAGRTADAARLAAVLDQTAPPRLHDAARLYASMGWAVFPLIPGKKAPATRNGFKDATTDPDQIDKWWKATPRANIGLPTGHRFDVVDVDAPDGWVAYLSMVDEDVLPDVHGVATTAGGGLHLYVKPADVGNRAGIRPGIDYRGRGGYVVAPPSVDHRGYRYEWRHRPSPAIADVPAPTAATR